MIHQIDSGAQCVLVRWFRVGSCRRTYGRVVEAVHSASDCKGGGKYPSVRLTLYANRNSGLMKRIALLNVGCMRFELDD